jgi:uncharacterized RDD family membrane protein YckC
MESKKHALVLSGELLPGFDGASVWTAVAAYFRIDQARLDSEVLARVPMTIKESDDADDLGRRRTALADIGALSDIYPLDSGSYFVLIDNVPRGPLPRACIDQRIRSGTWPAGIKAAAVGSTDWKAWEIASAPAAAAATPVPPPIPSSADAQAEADTVAAKIARVADSIASRKEQILPLPAGEAIHAGFWRRCAAYLIDNLILFIPSVIVLLVPILGYLVYWGGRWAYFAMMESSPSQATLGKRAMGLIATDGKGQRLSLGQASGRYFAGAISTITLDIGYALAGWTTRKQALHDLIADTCVVFDTVKPGQPMPTVRPPMPWYGWAANCVLLAVVPIAILAAIAIPAYSQYLTRAKVSSAMIEADALRAEVASAVAAGQDCPGHVRESNDPLIDSFRFSGQAPDCIITLSFSSNVATPQQVRGQSVEWTYAETGEWTCSSSLDPRFLPASCRP